MSAINIDLKKDYKFIIESLLIGEFNITSNYIPAEYDKTIILFSKIFRQQAYLMNAWDIIEHPDLNIPPLLQKGYESLKQALKTGNRDILKYLTTLINNADHSDQMLDCDCIYHFHLSSEPHQANPRFNKRTDERAFVYFDKNENKAYIIDIYKHGAEKKQVRDRIIKLWQKYPKACINNVKKGKLLTQFNDEEITSLRQNQINGFIQLDEEHFFIPSGGVTLAGTSMEDTFYLIQTNKNLTNLEKKIKIDIIPNFKCNGTIKVKIYNKKFDVYLKISINGIIKLDTIIFHLLKSNQTVL